MAQILLSEVFRQVDSTFVTLLNEMRRARLSDFSVALLRHAVAAPPSLTVVPTKLYPHNASAEVSMHMLPRKRIQLVRSWR